MAIKSLEEKKKQNKFIIIGAIIFVAALVVLYFAFWQKKPASPEGQVIITTKEAVRDQKLKSADLNFDFLTNKVFTFLKSHGNLPVTKGTPGKTNPFSP